jgi:hypothetical protein
MQTVRQPQLEGGGVGFGTFRSHAAADLNHLLVEPKTHEIYMMRGRSKRAPPPLARRSLPLRHVMGRGGKNRTHGDQLAESASLEDAAGLADGAG